MTALVARYQRYLIFAHILEVVFRLPRSVRGSIVIGANCWFGLASRLEMSKTTMKVTFPGFLPSSPMAFDDIVL